MLEPSQWLRWYEPVTWQYQLTKIPLAKWRFQKMEDKIKPAIHHSRGEKTSFGFKKPSSSLNTQTNNNSAPITPIVTDLSESIESLVITQTTARSGTPRLPRPNKDANGNCGIRTNRFGFRSPIPISNKVADSHSNNVNMSKDNTNSSSSLRYDTNRSQSAGRPSTDLIDIPNNNETSIRRVSHQHPTRFTLHTSSLPRPQFPVRLASPASYHAVDKNAKTAANNHTARKMRSENGGSSASSVTDVDSGVGSQKSNGEGEIIEQLDSSPSIRNRHRNPNIQKSRPLEMVFSGGCKKTFELRDLNDSIEVTEIMPLQLPPLPNLRLSEISPIRLRQRNNVMNTVASDGISGSDDDADDGYVETREEKFNRDRLFSEKNEKGFHSVAEENNGEGGEDLWGHEEAMAGEDDVNLSHSHSDSEEDFSGSPGSPGTPTHASNSLSLSSDARDFLIDDEIADQPGLVFDETITATSSGKTLVAQTPQESELTPEPLFIKPVSIAGRIALNNTPGRHNSVGTLSPCESIASDDMMMDYDHSDITSILDDDSHDLRSFYRLDGFTSDMAHLTDVEADNELLTPKELSSIMATRPDVDPGKE